MTSAQPRQRRNAISSSSVVRQPCTGGGRSSTARAFRATCGFRVVRARATLLSESVFLDMKKQ